MTTLYNGQLEIDHERGVIYFHQDSKRDQQPTLLRICNLDFIPHNTVFIDITHLHGLWIEPTPETNESLEVLMTDEHKQMVKKINES